MPEMNKWADKSLGNNRVVRDLIISKNEYKFRDCDNLLEKVHKIPNSHLSLVYVPMTK